MSAAAGTIFTFSAGSLLKAGPGSLAAPGNFVALTINIGLLGAAVQVTGVYVGVISVQVSLDHGVTYTEIDTIDSQQLTKIYTFPQNGPLLYTDFRLNGKTWTSGNAFIQILPWNPLAVPTIIGSNGVPQPAHAPDKFKIAAAVNAGNTALWSPGPTKQFRVLTIRIQPSADVSISSAAGSGVSVLVDLLDGSTSLNIQTSFWIPKNIPASPNTFLPMEIDLGPIGYLSQADGNVLFVNLPLTLTTGFMRVEAFGTEE
jgi:hypothetical protein